MEEVMLRDLHVLPELAYRLEDKDEIEILARSIEKEGLIHNLVVDDDGGVRGGTRRFGAMTLLKWDEPIPVKRVRADVGAALVAMIISNRHKESDPIADSELIDRALKVEGWGYGDVAEAIGESEKWVALRANLHKLHPKVRELLKNPAHFMRQWPIEWLQEFAILSPETQLKAVEDESQELPHIRSLEHLERYIGQRLQVIGKAPWDPEDKLLVPDAGTDGSCVTCPEQSQNAPVLFDEVVDKGDINAAVCRNKECWGRKLGACALQTIAKMKDKNPRSAVVAGQMARKRVPSLSTVSAYQDHEVAPCSKSEKGAIPAILFSEDGSFKKGFIREPSKDPPQAAKPAKAKKPERTFAEKLSDSRADYEGRRMAFVVDTVIELVRSADTPEADVVLGFAIAYGVEGPTTDSGTPRNLHGNKKARLELFLRNRHPAETSPELWRRMPDRIISSIGRRSRDEIGGEYEEAVWIAEMLGSPEDGLWAKAVEAIPDPKWWGEKKKKPKKASKAGKEPDEPKRRKSGRPEDGFQPE